MLKGFEHVGMTCGDADRTVDFYCGLLGLRLVRRAPTADGGEVLFLDAGGGMLEIVRPGSAAPGRARDVPLTEAGIRHITFAVTDVDAAYRRLSDAGIVFTEAPRPAINKEIVARVAFCRDPDGITVELIERAPGRQP